MNPIFWRRTRKGVQALALALFVALIALSWQGTRPALGTDTLLRLDPLAALTAMIASRQWLSRFIPALVLLAATVVLGRFWCGWLCPLGTLLDWTPARDLPKGQNQPSRWHGLKVGLLFVILFAALWGNLTLLILDPLTIFVRSLGALILPGLQWLLTRVEFALYSIGFLRGAVGAVDAVLRSTVFSYQQSYSTGVWSIALLLTGILASNLIARRAWCRYLCPLGGLFSLVARVSWLKRRVADRCIGCQACARDCRMGAIDPVQGFRSGSGECVAVHGLRTFVPQAGDLLSGPAKSGSLVGLRSIAAPGAGRAGFEYRRSCLAQDCPHSTSSTHFSVAATGRGHARDRFSGVVYPLWRVHARLPNAGPTT